MLCADDAGIVSRIALSSKKMVVIIVNVRREFGLTVSEAKTETMCIRLKEYGEVRFDANAVDQMLLTNRRTNYYIPWGVHQ